MEEYKPVLANPLYEVSNFGNVRSLFYGTKPRKLRVKKGYRCVALVVNGKQKEFRVHRLVYESFVEPIPDNMEIDHINWVRSDNRLENLRIVTKAENRKNRRSYTNRLKEAFSGGMISQEAYEFLTGEQ